MDGGWKARMDQLRAFVQDVNQEVRRVTWPTSKELLGATVVVVATTFVLAVVLSLYDLVISKALRAILQ